MRTVTRHLRVSLFALIAALLLASGSLAAQNVPTASGWIAWLFEPSTGTLTQIREDGSLALELTLPLSPAFNEYGIHAAVSPSGTHVAYTGADTLTAGISNRQLFIYDIALRSVVATYSLPPEAETHSLETVLDGQFFDEAARQMAFGYVLPGTDRWEIVIIDYGFGDVVATLTSDDPGTDVVERDLIVPAVQRYESGVVTFSTVYYATEGSAEYPTFAWDTNTGEISPSDAYTTAINDTLTSTGEVIAPGYDDRFEVVAQGAGNVPLLNVLTVYDPAAGERFPFYHDAARTLLGAYFVQNGLRVLASGYDPASETNSWTVVQRDGTPVYTMTAPASVMRVYGTADGFVYLNATGSPTLNHIVSEGDAFSPRTVWQSASGRFINLIFVQSLAPPAPTLPDWARLAGPQPIAQ